MVKIIQRPPNQLILRRRPLGLWLVGSFFTIVGVVVIILFSKASIFTCEREQVNQGNCELKQAYFLMSQKIIFSLNELKGAEIVTTHVRGMDSFFLRQPHYQVMLLTQTEKIPLTPYGTVNREKQDTVTAQINTFLHNLQETSLIIKQDNRWLVFFIGSIFISIGLLAELSQIITVTFDKAVGSFKIERQGVIRTQVSEHPLEEIAEVKLRISSYFNSKTLLYQVVLVLKSGQNILLSPNSHRNKARKQRIANEIANFVEQWG